MWELMTERLLVDQDQWLMYTLQWLAKIALVAYLTQAPGGRTHKSSDVCNVGEMSIVFL